MFSKTKNISKDSIYRYIKQKNLQPALKEKRKKKKEKKNKNKEELKEKNLADERFEDNEQFE